MVNKRMYQRIQSMKKKGYGKNAIAEELKIDPATVRKYYNMDGAQYGQYMEKCLSRSKQFESYQTEILELYKENHQVRLNMAAVYDYLEEKHGSLPGTEKSLRNYLHFLETVGVLHYEPAGRWYQRVPELPYGKQMQFDFGEYRLKSGAKLYIFGAVLSASRYKYVAFQDHPFKTVDVILHLLDCFDYFRGMPEELVIDQDSVLVVDENHGEILYTQAFSAFLDEMGLKMYVCRKADPESKGKVENLIKYVKYNFLQVRSFQSFHEVQDGLRRWLARRANGKICQRTKKVPSIAFEEEKPYLRALRNSVFRKDVHVGRETRMVSEKSFIMVGSNEYSVPNEYRSRPVEIYTSEEELFIFHAQTGTQIARHTLSLETGKTIRDKAHFRSNSLSLKELEDQTMALFTFEGWRLFVEKTRETFPRYFRDQCVLAKKLLRPIREDGLLTMAVDYCLANKTFGMAALADTYTYYKKEHEAEQKIIFRAFGKLSAMHKVGAPKITQRPIQEYESILAATGKNRARE